MKFNISTDWCWGRFLFGFCYDGGTLKIAILFLGFLAIDFNWFKDKD